MGEDCDKAPDGSRNVEDRPDSAAPDRTKVLRPVPREYERGHRSRAVGRMAESGLEYDEGDGEPSEAEVLSAIEVPEP